MRTGHHSSTRNRVSGVVSTSFGGSEALCCQTNTDQGRRKPLRQNVARILKHGRRTHLLRVRLFFGRELTVERLQAGWSAAVLAEQGDLELVAQK